MPTLIFLHGALGSSTYFDSISSQLADQFELHKITFSGHAGTPASAPLTIQLYVNEVVEYCKQKNIKNAYFFGYSMGGYVALSLAIQHPELVSKLMTLATKYAWKPEVAEKETKFLNPEVIKEKVPKYAQALALTHGDNWETLVTSIAQLLLALGNAPYLNSENLAQINCPVQVMSGDQDNMVTIEETLALARAINNAHVAVLPNTIHPFEKINQNLVIQILRDFFQ
jgi:pimeloyl-ACP methyl ester carboxylesterase